MTTTEKLQRIRAKCVDLLEIARPLRKCPFCGSDKIEVIYDDGYSVGCKECSTYIAPFLGADADNKQKHIEFWNTRACDGSTEAALKSTIAAIDDSIRQPVPEGWCHPDNPVYCENTPLINIILSAWLEELL